MSSSTIFSQPHCYQETAESFADWVDAASQAIAAEPVNTRRLRLDLASDCAPLSESLCLNRTGVPQTQAVTGVMEASPRRDRQQIRDMAHVLLERYSVRDGRIELSGCMLEPLPFLRLTVADEHSDRLNHFWFNKDGKPTEKEQVERLGLQDLVPIVPRLRRTDRAAMRQWIEAALACGIPVAVHPSRVIATTVAWCRYATGKITVTFDNGAVATIPFAGWAMDFYNGRSRPDPYHCPHSGQSSYEMLAIDQDTITVPQAVGRCEQTGQEWLVADLDRCEVTGKLVHKTLLVRCCSTGRLLLAEAARRCQWCDRPVVPGEYVDSRCPDCRSQVRIPKDHAVLERVLARYPEFASFGKWVGWADRSVAVFVGQRWMRQIAIVCDSDTGRLRLLRRRSSSRRPWELAAQNQEGNAGHPSGV